MVHILLLGNQCINNAINSTFIHTELQGISLFSHLDCFKEFLNVSTPGSCGKLNIVYSVWLILTGVKMVCSFISVCKLSERSCIVSVTEMQSQTNIQFNFDIFQYHGQQILLLYLKTKINKFHILVHIFY